MASSERTPAPIDNVHQIDDARRKRDQSNAPPGVDTLDSGKSGKSSRSKGPNFNHEKVAAIKAAIANGTYSINPQRIADKFIEQESS